MAGFGGLGRFGRLWQTQQVLADFGRLWQALADFGRFGGLGECRSPDRQVARSLLLVVVSWVIGLNCERVGNPC